MIDCTVIYPIKIIQTGINHKYQSFPNISHVFYKYPFEKFSFFSNTSIVVLLFIMHLHIL